MNYKFKEIRKAYEAIVADSMHLMHAATTLEGKFAIRDWMRGHLGKFEDAFPTLKPVFAKIEQNYSAVEAAELHSEFNNDVEHYR